MPDGRVFMAPRLAGINAEQSLREPEASERRHARDVAEEQFFNRIRMECSPIGRRC
jgi:hypothetical protein